jgi:hypothetical protein
MKMRPETHPIMVTLLDFLQNKYPQITHGKRIFLAQMVCGYSLMLRYGGTIGGTLEQPVTSEWLSGNSAFAEGYNALRAIVGEDAVRDIRKHICALVEQLVDKSVYQKRMTKE